MTDSENVSLKDVYDLVDSSRKELSTSIEKVNGDVTDIKVQVGQIETNMGNQDTRITDNTSRVRTLEKKVHDQRLRAAQLGGVVGGVITIVLQGIEFLLSRVP